MNNNPPVQGANSLHFIVPSQTKPRRKLTVEVITERLEGRNITLLSYGGSTNAKSSWKCCVCEYEWDAIAGNVLSGKGCPACSGNVRLTVEVITERLEGRNITLLSYAGGVMKKSLWKCCTCECEWSATANDILNGGSGCPACAGNAHLTIETITERLEGSNITLLNYGGSAKAKSSWKCYTCEYEWSATTDNVLRGSGCPACSGNARLTIEIITERLEGRNITLLIYGGNTMKKSQWKCDVCSHEWKTNAGSILKGRGCPQCAEYGYNPGKPGTLYALRSDCGRYVKIGVTNNFKQRFHILKRVTPFDVSVIERIECDGQTARRFEKMFHNEFESAGFTGFDGATEWLCWSTELQHWLRLLK